MGLLYFIIMVGVLIFIHEFGHYFFAKLFKVKVERFAIGMGPVLGPLSFQKGETEYALCALPIGGYVKMYGMQPEELYTEDGERVSDEEASRAFVSKPLWQRSIIVLAGPVANLVLPLFIYFFFMMGTDALLPAELGNILPESPAARAKSLQPGEADGLRPGDKVVRIEGREVRYWDELTDRIRGSAGESLVVEVERGGALLEFRVEPEAYTHTSRGGFMRETYGRVGVGPASYAPILAVSEPEGAAARAGLKTFDRVISVGGKPVRRYLEIQAALDAAPSDRVEVVAMRPRPVAVLDGGLQVAEPVVVEVETSKVGGHRSLGVSPATMFLAAIEPQSPAAKAGLQVGDEVLKMNGRVYNHFDTLAEDIQQKYWQVMHDDKKQKPSEIQLSFVLTVKRGAEVFDVAYQPLVRELRGEFNEVFPRLWFGWKTYNDSEIPQPISVPWGDRVRLGVRIGFQETTHQALMLFNGLAYMIRNGATDALGGPLMIGDIASKAGHAGFRPFLNMMALISLNLGIINLLPIPVLDGGHLMLFALEAVKRRELTPRTRQIAYYVGFSMIVLLMLLALKNDIERYWQDFAEWFNT
jgi:regulator of sigma E protease